MPRDGHRPDRVRLDRPCGGGRAEERGVHRRPVRAGGVRSDVRRHRGSRRQRHHAGRGGRRRGHRPRGRRRAALVRRPALGRLLAGEAQGHPAQARGVDPGEPRRARAARVARRRKADPRHAHGRRAIGSQDHPVVRGDHRQGLRRDRPDRAGRPVARDPRADRRRRRDRALELPADRDRVEGGRRAVGGELGRAQAGFCLAAQRAPAGGARLGGRAARRRPQRRARTRARLGDALARHPGVDKIAFTGSTEIGRSLLRAIGETDVKAISLELGGKSPQVVLADVGDLEAAAAAIGSGIFYNSGQTCNAGSRLVVHRSVREELVERVAEIGRTLAPAEPLDPDTRLGSIVDERQLDTVLDYVELGQREGARLVTGGERVARGDRRLLRRTDDPRRGRQRLAGRARRDLRTGPDRHRVRGRGRRPPHRERHAVRPGRRPVDARHHPRASPGPGAAGRDRLRQHLRHGRHHGAVRRFQAVGLRARQVAPRARRLHPAQDDLDRPVRWMT